MNTALEYINYHHYGNLPAKPNLYQRISLLRPKVSRLKRAPAVSTSGSLNAEQIRDISNNGFQVIINLLPHISQDELPNEGQIVAKNFMTYINIPVFSDDPQVEQFLSFCSLLDSLGEQKIWVHCATNTRVSAFMFAYLHYHLGYPAELCQSPLHDNWSRNEIWNEFMQEVEEELLLDSNEILTAQA